MVHIHGAVDAPEANGHCDATGDEDEGGDGVERPGNDAVEALEEDGDDTDGAGDEPEGAGKGRVGCGCGHARHALETFLELALGQVDGEAEDDGAEDELGGGARGLAGTCLMGVWNRDWGAYLEEAEAACDCLHGCGFARGL